MGLHLASRSDIISVFRFGGLAQLVRAPASHAGGLGFESLILHHTVRTRTRFFTKKGSGTFFVYRRFCERTTRNSKRAKAGYHHDGGILPFSLKSSYHCANLIALMEKIILLVCAFVHLGRCADLLRTSVLVNGHIGSAAFNGASLGAACNGTGCNGTVNAALYRAVGDFENRLLTVVVQTGTHKAAHMGGTVCLDVHGHIAVVNDRGIVFSGEAFRLKADIRVGMSTRIAA